MKDGAIVCNTGPTTVKSRSPTLKRKPSRSAPSVGQRGIPHGRRSAIFLLARGRLVNLAAAEGHPSEVMDMSFANQFLSLVRLAKEGGSMGKQVYDITTEQDQDLATTKLGTLGFSIDKLTDAQLAYLDDYTVGT